MCYVSLNLFRDAYILKMARDICYQLKINNGKKMEVDIENKYLQKSEDDTEG